VACKMGQAAAWWPTRRPIRAGPLGGPPSGQNTYYKWGQLGFSNPNRPALQPLPPGRFAQPPSSWGPRPERCRPSAGEPPSAPSGPRRGQPPAPGPSSRVARLRRGRAPARTEGAKCPWPGPRARSRRGWVAPEPPWPVSRPRPAWSGRARAAMAGSAPVANVVGSCPSCRGRFQARTGAAASPPHTHKSAGVSATTTGRIEGH
jgi:hypothetical protein